ncbi:MAG: hypothetical protein AAFQ37_06850, partial [Bacteroidota bacterium]
MNKTLLLLLLALAHLSFTPFVSPEAAQHNAATTSEEHLRAFGGIRYDTLPPLQERYGNFVTDEDPNVIDLNDPSTIDQSVEYDPNSGLYIVRERMGSFDFRPPTYLTFDEYMEYRRQQDQKEYFDQLAGVGTGVSVDVEDPLANVDISESMLNRLFGSNEISIQPQGGVDLTFGFNYQKQENPFFTQRQQ